MLGNALQEQPTGFNNLYLSNNGVQINLNYRQTRINENIGPIARQLICIILFFILTLFTDYSDIDRINF